MTKRSGKGFAAGGSEVTWIPANRFRLSRCRDMIESVTAQRQETQIVQFCMTLDDFLPGFTPPVIRRPKVSGSGSASALPAGSWTAKPAATSSACLLALTQSRCFSDRVSLRPFSRHSIWYRPVFGSGNTLTRFRPLYPCRRGVYQVRS